MRKIVIGALLLMAIGAAGTAVTAIYTDVFSTKTVAYHEEEIVNGNDIKNLNISTSSSDITIVPTKSDEVKVVLEGQISERIKDKYKLIVDQAGDTLKVKTKNNLFFNTGIINIDLKLNVEVPEKVFESIAVSASSGRIDIHDLHAGKFKTNVSSGNITVDGVTVDSLLEVDASSGNLVLENVQGNITANVSSGSILVDNQKVSGDIVAEASSGDVKVSFKEAPTSLSIDFKASSGGGVVNLDGVRYEEKSDHLIKGSIGSGEHKLKVRMSSGEFELN